MLVIVCVVHLYNKITSASHSMICASVRGKNSVSYCVNCASVRKDNQCLLLYVLCICTGR